MTLRYVDIPVEAQSKAMLNQGMPEWQVTALLDLQAYYTDGKGGTLDGGLKRLLGRLSIPGRICRRISRPGGEGLRRSTVDPLNAKTSMTHAEVQYVSGELKRFPDLPVHIEDKIANDKVMVRNHWTGLIENNGKARKSLGPGQESAGLRAMELAADPLLINPA